MIFCFRARTGRKVAQFVCFAQECTLILRNLVFSRNFFSFDGYLVYVSYVLCLILCEATKFGLDKLNEVFCLHHD
jgi:hypothetical protein